MHRTRSPRPASTRLRSHPISALVALGATVAVMLVGGVSLASASHATNNPNPSPGNSGSSSSGGNGNAANPQPGGGNGNNGQGINGASDDGGQGHFAVTICHATRSASNPYVVITVDASSITRLMNSLLIGNGHGDHVGAVFDPATNRSGDNWGDIIPPITNPRTGELAFAGINTGSVDWIARGCAAPMVTVYWTYCAADGQEPARSGTAATREEAIAQLNSKLPADHQYGGAGSADPDATLDCGSSVAVTTCPTTSTVNAGVAVPTGTTAAAFCNAGGSQAALAADGAAYCDVTDGAYHGLSSVQVSNVGGATPALAQANADALVVASLQALATGDNIVPPHKAFTGYNWNGATQGRFAGGCSPNQTVVAALSSVTGSAAAPLPGTASGSTTQPGTVAGTTSQPGTVAGTTSQPGTVAGTTSQPGTVSVPTSASLPAAVPAGDGSTAPSTGLSLWAMVALGMALLGAGAAGLSLAMPGLRNAAHS